MQKPKKPRLTNSESLFLSYLSRRSDLRSIMIRQPTQLEEKPRSHLGSGSKRPRYSTKEVIEYQYSTYVCFCSSFFFNHGMLNFDLCFRVSVLIIWNLCMHIFFFEYIYFALCSRILFISLFYSV